MHVETLKMFCDLVETQSIARAAERSFVTQSAISWQMRTLEDKFGYQLLVRRTHEISLTTAGEVFYRECKNVLAGYDALREEMRRGGAACSTVKVASVYTVGLYELPPKMREYMKKFPAAKIDLEYSRPAQVVRDVQSRTVDVGVIAFPEQRRGLTIVPMTAGRMVLICPPVHELAERRRIKVEELTGRDFVLFERHMPTRKATDKILKSYGVEICQTAEFANIKTIKSSVEAGFGLAIVPHSSVMEEKRQKTLSVIEFAEKDWIHPVGVIYRKDETLSPAAKKFVRLLGSGS